MKKFVGIIFAIAMIFSIATSAQSPEVTVLLDGKKIEFDVPAQIIESNTMVPLRAIFEALGADVTWDDTTKTVSSSKGDTKVSLTIGQKIIKVNGTEKPLLVAPVIIDSRTLVPVRAISESYGCKVGWIDETKTVTIEMQKISETEPKVVKEILLQDGSSNENGLFAENATLFLVKEDVTGNNDAFKVDAKYPPLKKSYLKQKMDFEPGHVYEYSVDVKAVDESRNKRTVSLFFNMSGKETVLNSRSIFHDKWMNISGTFFVPYNYVPNSEKDVFGAYATPVKSTAVSYLVDNISLTHAPLRKEDETGEKIVLFQGDSITDALRSRGDFWSLGDGYANMVAKDISAKYPDQYKFVNKGESGSQLMGLYTRRNSDIIGINPDYISIMIGVNDVWRKHDSGAQLNLETYEKYYCSLIEKTMQANPDVKIMLIGPYVLKGSGTIEYYDAFRADILEMNKIVKSIAEKYDLPFLPLMSILEKEAEGKAQGYLSGDGVHPSQIGCEIIAREWVKVFEENFCK